MLVKPFLGARSIAEEARASEAFLVRAASSPAAATRQLRGRGPQPTGDLEGTFRGSATHLLQVWELSRV